MMFREINYVYPENSMKYVDILRAKYSFAERRIKWYCSYYSVLNG
jgi:hypothetical protein